MGGVNLTSLAKVFSKFAKYPREITFARLRLGGDKYHPNW